jgi:hypothetical protein
VSVAFHNVWPTPRIRWNGQLSVELALAVLAFALARQLGGAAGRRAVRWASAAWVALVIGRYLDVMAPALYGRPINLYWDSRHMKAVFEMMTNSVPAPLVLGGLVAVVALLGVAYVAARWAWSRVIAGLEHTGARRALVTAAGLVVCLWGAQHLAAVGPQSSPVASTVSRAYWRHASLLATQLTSRAERAAASRVSVESDLGAVRGADVYLLFVESYGAVTYDRPEVASLVSEARARFKTAVRESGRQVVSAFVESPTFAGSSWLAHVSLLTGVETRDEGANGLLMSQFRDTLVTTFSRQGYRTVALMPGLSHSWPEGGFYRFDHIYDEYAMDYQGPVFSWWTVPDQFALARLDALEDSRQAPGQSRFVFFPTTSTHAPFGPTAPYQSDWERVVSRAPYDAAAVAREKALEPDWTNMAPSYGHAVSYAYDSIGGYLRRHAGRDIVVVMLGDHQPAAAVAGDGASWDVPVHIIASRREVLDRLLARGFHEGLAPPRRAIGKMHTLLPVLLDTFGSGTPGGAVSAVDPGVAQPALPLHRAGE